MKFTWTWLKEHLATDAPLDAVAEKLTALGLEVEGVEDKRAVLAPFTVASVLEAKPHPNADKLRVCMVDTGQETLQIVCGAPNARTGMKGVLARLGTTIPGTGLTLTPVKIRGVESQGMLCSEREMGLSNEHDGIIDLPADAPVGVPFAEVLGLDDPVIEIAITPNRGDCLGVHGVARDLAASGQGRLKAQHVEPVAGRFPCPIPIGLHFAPADASACPMFAGRVVRGVRNGPSPAWLQQRLRAVGLRPINALVDITNFVSLDRARPLHVYDADKLKGEIHARLARPGEQLKALDGKTYPLQPTMCVIADASGVLGLGGIMGGEATGSSEATRTVFIESALFEPASIARTGRALSLLSDARYRFERGVDPAFVVPGLELATRLILELCGGEASEVIVAGGAPGRAGPIDFAPADVPRLTGLDLEPQRIALILESLGATVESVRTPGRTHFLVTPPTWRPDLHGRADLVEEVVRIHGLEHVPATPLPPAPLNAKAVLTPLQKRVRLAKRALAARGLIETVSYSFLASAHARPFLREGDPIRLANPISADLDAMRPSILPSLLAAAQRNADRGFGDSALFEVGPVFTGIEPGRQAFVAAGVRRGATGPRHWQSAQRPNDIFEAKADALALLEALGAPGESAPIAADAPAWYHPGRSGSVRLGPKLVLAHFGVLHPDVLEAMDVKGPVVGFEVFLENIPEPKPRATKSRGALQASDLMAVERDFAFVVDEAIEAQAVLRAARGADRVLITDVRVFDVFTGESVGAGKKSVAIAVTLQPRDRTLTDAEIDAVSNAIVGAVAKATGATLRR